MSSRSADRRAEGGKSLRWWSKGQDCLLVYHNVTSLKKTLTLTLTPDPRVRPVQLFSFIMKTSKHLDHMS